MKRLVNIDEKRVFGPVLACFALEMPHVTCARAINHRGGPGPLPPGGHLYRRAYEAEGAAEGGLGQVDQRGRPRAL